MRSTSSADPVTGVPVTWTMDRSRSRLSLKVDGKTNVGKGLKRDDSGLKLRHALSVSHKNGSLRLPGPRNRELCNLICIPYFKQEKITAPENYQVCDTNLESV